MKNLLTRLINQEILSKDESKKVLIDISKGEFSDSQIAAFLTVFMMRSVSIEELEGFRDGLLELCLPIDLNDFNLVDLCGTGGDGKDTFNISTLASFITAGAGVQVAKHGNYGVSSNCGSSNVMEFLGVKFYNRQDLLKRSIEKAGICFLHAAHFHPAMKKVAPIRKTLAVKTFFNMLGPMVNPAFPKNQVVGVFSLELARIYGYLYQKTALNFSILHSLDGYDEISLTGDTKIISNRTEGLLTPQDFGFQKIDPTAISGGNSVESAAKIFMNILNGEGTEAQNNVVCANAGMAISTVKNISLLEGFEQAKEALLSKKALSALKKLQELN